MKKILMTVLTAGLALAMVSTAGTAYADSKSLESDASVNFYLPEDYEYLLAEPLDPEDPDNDSYNPVEGEGNKQTSNGPLSIDYASHISFGKQELSLNQLSIKSETKTPYVQVTDQSFSEEGWILSTQLTNFNKVAEGEENESKESTLNGSAIKFNNTKADAKNDIKQNISEPETLEEFELVAGGSANKIASANTASNIEVNNKAQGLGTWIITWLANEDDSDNENSNVILEVPAATATSGDHEAKINWTLSSGPEA